MDKVFVVGVAGGSGSGKTTFAKKLKETLGDSAEMLTCDNYYYANDGLTHEQRAALNFDSPDAIEFSLMSEHLAALREGRSVESPIYDFTEHTRLDKTVTVHARPVIIVEGILVLSRPELRELMDLKIFVDTDADERILRRAKRDMEERGRTFDDIMEQYLTTVKPMHYEHVEPSRAFADMVLNGGMNPIVLDMVKSRIELFHATA